MTTLSALSNTSTEDQLEAALKCLRSGPKKSWSTQRSELIAAHRAEKLVFVLGAGISIDNGLPAWTVLPQELLMRTLGDPESGDGEQRGKLAKAYTDFYKASPLMAAGYTRLKPKDGFIDAVREVLCARVDDAGNAPLMKAIRTFVLAAGYSTYTPSRSNMWKWIFRFGALPKRWIRVTAPAWAVYREDPAFLIKCVAMPRQTMPGT